jgi:hypothetical protein
VTEFCRHCGQEIVTAQERGVEVWLHADTGRTACEECIEGGAAEPLSVAEPLPRPKMSAAELEQEGEFFMQICEQVENEEETVGDSSQGVAASDW